MDVTATEIYPLSYGNKEFKLLNYRSASWTLGLMVKWYVSAMHCQLDCT
jgi:hypothetical protein